MSPLNSPIRAQFCLDQEIEPPSPLIESQVFVSPLLQAAELSYVPKHYPQPLTSPSLYRARSFE